MDSEYYKDILNILKIVKMFIINFLTLYTSIKIINKQNNCKEKVSGKHLIFEALLVFIFLGIGIFIENKSNKFYSVVYFTLFLTVECQ